MSAAAYAARWREEAARLRAGTLDGGYTPAADERAIELSRARDDARADQLDECADDIAPRAAETTGPPPMRWECQTPDCGSSTFYLAHIDLTAVCTQCAAVTPLGIAGFTTPG